MTSLSEKKKLALWSSGIEVEQKEAAEENRQDSKSSSHKPSGSLLLLPNASETAKVPEYLLGAFPTGELSGTVLANRLCSRFCLVVFVRYKISIFLQ